MKSSPAFFDRLAMLLYRICTVCSLIIASIMTSLVFAQVVLRYVFNIGYPGIEEISLICMMWIAFFGGSLIFAEQAGISVTVLVERLAPEKFRWAKLIFHLLTIVFLCLLIWYGWRFALVGQRMMFGASQISKFWSYLAIPVGAAFSLVFELNHLLRTIRSDKENFLGMQAGEGA